MKHGDLPDNWVKSASFSPDGKWVVTASYDDTARVWDAQTGQPVGQPLNHDWSVNSASFSPDGKWVVTASRDKTARVWDVVIADKQAPTWMAELAETIGGQRINQQGALEPFPQDLAQLRQELQTLSGDDDLSCFGRWILANPSARTISPLSTITMPEFVATRLRENTPESINEAWNADPSNPVVLAALAKITFTTDKSEARFYFQVALRYAQLAGEPEQITQVQAMAKSLFPDAAQFDGPSAEANP
jgi:WD40 repeat protein